MTRVARALGVRPGEGRLVGLVAAVFATIETARGFGEIAADSLVIGRFGTGSLPFLFIVLGVASLVAALAYGAALGRLRRGRLFVAVLLLLAAVIAAEQLALVAGLPIVPLIWLTIYAAGAVAVTLVWTLAGSVLDARQAKRLFPVLTSAAIVGSFVGTLGAGPAARLVGTEWVVVLEAVGLAIAAALVARLATRTESTRLRAAPPRRPVTAELRAGFDFVVRSPLMRLVAVAYVLLSVLMFSVTSPFFQAMADAFPAGASAELTTALGLLSAAVTATSLVVSLAIAPRIYGRFGVATAALVLPIVYVAGFGLWIVAFAPVTAVLVRYVQQVTQRGLSNSAWSAFYNVVPAAQRPQVLAFNDGVPGQLGIVLSGVLLLTVETLLTPDQIPWLGLVAAVVCTAVVLAIRRRYADALVRALRAGLAEQVLEGGPGLAALQADGQTTAALRRGLDDPTPAVRVMAAELLGRLRVTEAKEAVAARVDDPDPAVRAAAIAALASLDGSATAPIIGRALADPAPAVRAAAIDAAARVEPEAVARKTDELAADPDAGVRGALAVALAAAGAGERSAALTTTLLSAETLSDRVAGLQALGRIEAARTATAATATPRPAPDGNADPVLRALGDDATPVRRAAAEVLRARPSAPPPLFGLLADGSPDTQEAVLWALDGHGAEAREAVLGWARGQVARATELRRRLQTLDTGAPPDGAHGFLMFILARRQSEILGRLLTALAVLGAPEAGGLLRRCLLSGDPEVRAQAIEAVDSVGDHELRRAIVRLLDATGSETGASGDEVLRDLESDPDRWIRALAVRARGERAVADWFTIRVRARNDPDGVVRAALDGLGDGGGLPMPDQARTLGDIDRMLFLRRVPLFAELAPEDLQRIAMTATEWLYGPNEVVVREGEVADELVVIVEGAVRVVHVEADGKERALRRIQTGEHFGELAVLREAPRAATVIAEPPGVRGLMIGGDGLTAILRERPAAAMAMLATLATRISQQ
jgi:HEAT repeat protein